MDQNMPNIILERLLQNGYEAYFVGGCVRDALLHRTIHDWDITTSALPEQVMACFSNCVPTGIRHGTVTVLDDGFRAEVTTYRADGTYADGRHPDQVSFVRTLSEDLARRDFTINAMAMDSCGRIIDLYGGREDLKCRLIRCVGEPRKRFEEDALRMFRALRFSAQLGFAIDTLTREAIGVCACLSDKLSAERIREEVEKILLSDHPEKLRELAVLGLLNRFGPDLQADCGWLSSLPRERMVRWAGLCRLWPKLDLVSLRLDRRTVQDAPRAAASSPPVTRLDMKRMIVELGPEPAAIASRLHGAYELYQQVMQSGECISLRQLAVNGSDFPEYHGKKLGELLHRILQDVLEEPELNKREIIFEKYKNSIDYYY